MKSILILTLALFSSIGYAQTDCKPYLPATKGSTWELTNYNPKGKATGTVTYELTDKIVSGNTITFTVTNTSYDKKGKETFKNTSEAKCHNGQFEFDMSFMMDGSALEAYQSMEVDIDASDFEIPKLDAAGGTTLKDGTLKVSVGASGVTMFSMTVLVTDRKVELREDRTTPAGTFNCIKLTQKVMTRMVMKIEGASTEWYAENVGMVRSESYNKKGKMTGYTELTKLDIK